MNFLKENKRSIIRDIAILMAMITFLMIWALDNRVSALEIMYDGKTIGYVENEDVLQEAEDKIIGDNDVIKNIVNEKVESSETKVKKDDLITATELSKELLRTSDEVIDGYSFYVNDEAILKTKSKDYILNAIDNLKKKAEAENDKKSVSFNFDYEIRAERIAVKESLSQDSIEKVLEKYGVVTYDVTGTRTEVGPVKFDTVYVDDETVAAGVSYVKTEGTNGTKTTTYKTEYKDGKVEKETVIGEEIKSPIDRVIIKGTGTNTTLRVSSKKPQESGFIVPVSGYFVSSPYGMRGGKLHQGIDLACGIGTPISSAKAGVVIETGSSPSGYGNYIIIKHDDNTQTLYAHCSKIYAKEGQSVKQSSIIAAVGSTGHSTGPHLHFEIRIKGTAKNPADYLAF